MKKSRDKTNDGVRGVTTETWLLANCFVAHSAHCVRSPASPSLILQAVGLHDVDVIITIYWMDRPVRCLGCALSHVPPPRDPHDAWPYDRLPR